MTRKFSTKSKGFVITFVSVLILTNVLTFLLICSVNSISYSDNEYFPQNNPPIPQSFTKDDYEPILSEKKHGLGNVTVTNMSFEDTYEDEVGYYYDEVGLFDDYFLGVLNISLIESIFIKTKTPAIVENLNENITDSNIITVVINETISFQYNKSLNEAIFEGYLVYLTRLYPAVLVEFFVQNGTEPVQSVNEGNYSVDSNNILKFEYYNFFGGINATNFSLYLIYEYNLTLDNWHLQQYEDSESNLLVSQQTQTITPEFNYYFTLNGKRYNSSEALATVPVIPAYDINFQLQINLPDKDLLKSHELVLKGVSIPANLLYLYLDPDNSMNVSDDFNGNSSVFSLNFEADFQIQFFDAVEDTWSIDRLVSGRDTRERIYFPSVISGPETIYIEKLYIFETTIIVTQVAGNSSLFERVVNYFDANISVIEEDIHNSLIFTENATKKKGLEIKLPYIIKGEICPFSLKYTATRTLRIIITDNIFMPLSNVQVKIYYYGVLYGTYISKQNYQPISPAITDENGAITLLHVPEGNYTLRIFQNEELLVETSVSSYVDINYVVTTIPHIPIWIIIFGSINGVLVSIGFLIYRKNKR